MIAPPQVQAQSFAKAILTDITLSPFLAFRGDEKGWRRSIAVEALTSRCKRSL
jgi:hypothetical protein